MRQWTVVVKWIFIALVVLVIGYLMASCASRPRDPLLQKLEQQLWKGEKK